MTGFWFPDTTVFRTFAAGERLDLLESFLSGNGRWTEVVERETQYSLDAHPTLSQVFDWFPDSERPSGDAELLEIEKFRTINMAGDPMDGRQHLGESQTFIIVKNRKYLQGSTFITDDRDAFDLFPGRGLPTQHTLQILQTLVARYELTADDAYDFVCRCEDLGRHFLDHCFAPAYFKF